MDDELLNHVFDILKGDKSAAEKIVKSTGKQVEPKEKKPKKTRTWTDEEREVVRERLAKARIKGQETRRLQAEERAKLKEQAKTEKLEAYKEKIGLKPRRLQGDSKQGAMPEPAKPVAPEFDMASFKEQIKRELMGAMQQSAMQQQEPIKKAEEPKQDAKQEPAKKVEELTLTKPKELDAKQEVSSEYLRKRALLSTYLSKRR